MNVFLACFVAVIFASIVKDVAGRTLAQMWVAHQLRRAGVRRVGPRAIAASGTVRYGVEVTDVHQQIEAFGDLHIAAIEMADSPISYDATGAELSNPEAVTQLVAAAKRMRASLSDRTVKVIRDTHKRSEPTA